MLRARNIWSLRCRQALLGHASANTTQIYTAVTQQRQAQIVTAALRQARTVEASPEAASREEPSGTET